MKDSVSIVLVGVAGYGKMYLKKLLEEGDQWQATIAGVVDLYPEKSAYYDELMSKNIPIFTSLEQFYEQHQADLAILSTPIHLHAQQTCYALEQGSHVLCEKPMCASLEEAEQIIQTRNKTGKFVAIGFNWSFSPSVHQFKQDMIAGVFGKPIRMKTLVKWPRDIKYFNRNSWAGRLFSEQGAPIFDSVANNATSHFLHHMFYLLGDRIDRSATLSDVTAELYRANDIENFDTCAVKATTKEGVDIFFYATHSVKEQFGPTYIYEFEKAVISGDRYGQIIVNFHDGTVKVYPNPEIDHSEKLPTCIKMVREGKKDIVCGPEAAMTHLQCIMAMHESAPEITDFPKQLIQFEEASQITWVEGLSETLTDCYDQWTLPSELNREWARAGNTIAINS